MTLPEELESAAIGAMVTGKLSADNIDQSVLSRTGQFVVKEFKNFTKPPSFNDIYSLACSKDGVDISQLKQYLKTAEEYAGTENITSIIQQWEDREKLLLLQNECIKQMAEGYNEELLERVIKGKSRSTTQFVDSLADNVGDDLPVPPTGIPIKSLPNINEKIGGLQFLMAIGGGPGVGKSTLAVQCMVDWLHAGRKVLYYDFENSPSEIIRRVADLCRSPRHIKDTLRHCYYRDGIKSLSSDAKAIEPGSLIIIDSFHKLPSKVDQRRSTLDKWLQTFEAIKKTGHTILILSEVSKQIYVGNKQPSIGDYKETGEIEYSVDCGIQLRKSRLSSGLVELWVVKNRSRGGEGKLGLLERKSFGKFEEYIPAHQNTGPRPGSIQRIEGNGW